MNYPSLVWLDLEMTDLDPVLGKVVEIASVITDQELNIIAKGPNVVIHQPTSVLDKMLLWNKNHFTDSGLMKEIRESKKTVQDAEEATLKFISQHFQSQAAMLAGNSVYVDREFIAVHMPALFAYLHYRIVDVNTVRELAHRWYPNVPSFYKEEKHRAMSDCLESIAELKYFRDTIFAKQ